MPIKRASKTPPAPPKIGRLHAWRRRWLPERLWQRYVLRLSEQQQEYDKWKGNQPENRPARRQVRCEPCNGEGLDRYDALCKNCEGTGKMWITTPRPPPRPDPGQSMLY